MALFLCQAAGKTQPASASRTVPTPSFGNQGRFYTRGSQSGYKIRIKVVKVLHSSSRVISKVTAGASQPGNWVFFSEMQMLQGVICYKGVQDVIHILLKKIS